MSEGSSLPFPDLTGLRTRANDRHRSTTPVRATLDLSISADELEKIARSIGDDVEAKDLIVIGWMVVLLHMLSADDACETSTILVDGGAAWQATHSSDRKERRSMSLQDILTAYKRSRKQIGRTQEGRADNAVVFAKSSPANVVAAVTLSAHQESQTWHFELQASAQNHTEQSAKLQLAQVDAWLASLRSHPALPALDLDRLPYDLKAGDNISPVTSQADFKCGSVAEERFEYQFEKRATEFPDRVALDFRETLNSRADDRQSGNVQLTYAEVDAITTSIALQVVRHLPAKRAGENRIVALCLEKSQWTYLAIMAVLKADAAWCPIDTDWPEARRRALLMKCRASVVLTAGEAVRASLESIAPEGLAVLSLDQIDLASTGGETVLPSPRASADDLAYLIWTSGTTGLPKAVGIQHKAAVQALRSLQTVIPYDTSDTSKIRYLQFSAYNFDLMILDMFYTWGLGGTLCSSTRSTLLTSLVDVVKSFQASHTLLTPAVMAMTPRELMPSLRVVINGGEKLSQVVADMWSVDCCLLNLYGPAEATLIAMNRRVPPNDSVKAPNIGRALPTTSCHALDIDDKIVLKGAVGQLVLGGFQCALGYVGDQEKTADKFVEHSELGRIYKTGDMVRQLWNGDFEYLGRSDDQVKVNGIRIELLEINAAIRSAAEEVRDSETLVLPNSENDADIRIVNFSVVPSESDGEGLIRVDEHAAASASILIKQARKALPSYMVPSLFMIVNRFPKTSSAKIDREALKAALKDVDIIAWQNRVAAHGSEGNELLEGAIDEAARRTLEENIAFVCHISTEQIGLYTPLPSLGLDSIRAIGLVRRLNEAGVAVSVVDVLTHNTLALLLRHLNSDQSKETQEGTRRVIEKLDRFSASMCTDVQRLMGDNMHVAGVYPTTPLQDSLVAETMLDSSRYWLHRVFELRGISDATAESAIKGIVGDFDILRTAFLSVHDLDAKSSLDDFECAYIQVILKDAPIPIKHLSSITGSDENIALRARREHPLDITSRRPPVAFSLVEHPPRLIMHVHHALYDQISLEAIQASLDARLSGLMCETKGSSFVKALPYLLKEGKAERDRQLSIWSRILDGFPIGSAIEVPTFCPNKRITPSSEIETFRISVDETYESIAQHATSVNSTPRAVTQAILCILLSRLSGTTNVFLGDAISGRAVAHELDDTIGPVLATLPVYTALTAGTKFSKLCEALVKYYQDALPQAQVSLAKIRQLLHLPRSSETFQAMFVFEPPVVQSEANEANAHIRRIGDFGVSVEHKVAFEISFDKSQKMSLGLLVQKGSIDKAMAEIVLSQYETLLRFYLGNLEADIFASPSSDASTMAVSRYSPSEYLQQKASKSVFAAFVKMAMTKGEAKAVEFYESLDDARASRSLTYAELHEESSRLARLLKARMPKKSVIAVTLTRSLDSYIGFMAILKAGCTYLPIDVTIPQARKLVLLHDSKAAGVLCQSRTRWLEGQEGVQIIDMDEWRRDSNNSYENTALQEPLPSDAAYILYTSGSTGTPKGCRLTHSNLSATIAAFQDAYAKMAPGSLDDGVRFLARSIESFDVSLLEILLPLQIGGTIVTAPRQLLLANLGRAMQALQVTHAAVVPSLFSIDGRPVQPDDLPDLRALIVGGERIRREIITVWASSNVPLLNAYGPTEACIGNSMSRVRPNDSTGIIGKPFVSTKYIVLSTRQSDKLSVALRGEAGELCIGGMQVGSYIDNSHQDNFVTIDDVRYYRTGDEARMWHDDIVEYLGRIGGSDAQVKIRGVRIELGEIDAVFGSSKAAKKMTFATQLASHPHSTSEQLVTFFAHTSSSDISDVEEAMDDDTSTVALAALLLSFAKKRLPSNMTPVALIPVKQIPLTPVSGKVNRKALQNLFASLDLDSIRKSLASSTGNAEVEEFSETERSVLKLAGRYVREGDVTSPTLDLFTVGLDSLKVIQLAGLIERKHDVNIDLGQVMADASIRTFASYLNQGHTRHTLKADIERVKRGWGDLKQDALAAGKGGREISSVMPCLPLQASMVAQSLMDFEDRKKVTSSRDGLRYVNHARFEVSSDITSSQLEHALGQSLLHHDIYQTVFFELNGSWVQAVVCGTLQDYRFDSDQDDILWPTSARVNILQNIDRIPPIRYRVRSNKGKKLILEMVLHHAVYDGESLALLLREVGAICRGTTNASRKDGCFADVVASTLASMDQVEYWTKKLSALSIAHFPCLTGRRPKRHVEVVRSAKIVSRTPLSRVKERARQEGITLPMLFLHAFAVLYGKYTGDADVILGLVLNGRTGQSTGLHGPCVNTVPFGIKLDAIDCSGKIKADYAEALVHQHVPLTQLGRELQAPSGLFNCLFSFVTEDDSESIHKSFEELESNMLTGAPLALEISTRRENDAVLFELVYDPDLIPDEQASLMLKQLDQEVNQDLPADDDILSVSNPDCRPDKIKHFLDFFNEQVSERPNHIAFEFASNLDVDERLSVTYQELDHASSRIAFALASRLRQGRQGSIVGVHMSQCPEVYVILLALWKVSATYLPLDPKLPSDRLEYIVSAAKPDIVVSTGGTIEQARCLGSEVALYDDLLVQISDEDRLGTAYSTKGAAYLMFTSGSSGNPKGVQVSHEALGATLHSWRQILPHTPGKSRMLQLASPGFDVFLIEVCMPLAFGFTFVSAPKAALLDDLEKTFNVLEVSIADLPAALAVTIEPGNVPRLEWLMSGGDLMDQRVIDSWTETGLINAWGPTEATIGNTLGFVRHKDVSRNWIGYAYPTSTILVLDPNSDEIVPSGCVGELAVCGPQLGDGYFGKSELTAEKFVEILVPGQRKEKARTYRTGDLGRLLHDGGVECLGRIEGDGQVKINSQRVELKEIELAICRQRDVLDACVLYLEHKEAASKQLVAFIVLRTKSRRSKGVGGQKTLEVDESTQSRQTAEQAIAEVSRTLPPYMVPNVQIVLDDDSLPLTPNAKTDKKALKALFASLKFNRLGHDDTDEGNWTRNETLLRTILSNLIGIEASAIHRHTSLHRLGVDSISAFRVAKSLRNAGVAGVSARAVLSSPTVTRLARTFSERSHATVPEIQRIELSDAEIAGFKLDAKDRIIAILPCTALQEGMLLESIQSQGRLYVHRHTFEIPRQEDVSVFVKAWEQLVDRHEMLRTSFHAHTTQYGAFVQVVHEVGRLDVNIQQSSKDDSRFLHASEMADEEKLTRPPIQLRIVQGAPKAIATLTLHHALYDGESLEKLFLELQQIASGINSSGKATSFRAVLPHLLASKEANEFWADTLQNRQSSLLRRGDVPKGSTSCIVRVSELRGIDFKMMNDFAKALGVSLHTVALFAFSKLLAFLTKRRDVTFAQLFSLRDAASDVDGDNVIGPCLNTCLTAVDIVAKETVAEALIRLQKGNDQARQHRNASLADVQKRLMSSRGGGIEFDALFDMQRIMDGESEHDGQSIFERCEEQDDKTKQGLARSTQYALNFEFVQKAASFALVASAQTECFDGESLGRAMQLMEDILLHTLSNSVENLSTDMPSERSSLADLPMECHSVAARDAGYESGSETQVEDSIEDEKHHSPLKRLLLLAIVEIAGLKSAKIDAGIPLARLGLDSIASMRLASRLRKQGVKVGLIDVMQGKTVNGILRRLQALQDQENISEDLDKKEAGEKGPKSTQFEAEIEALPGQVFQLADQEEPYTFYYRLGDRSRIDPERLRKAWLLLCERHACLRVGFFQTEAGQIKQVCWRSTASLPASYKIIAAHEPTSLLASDKLQAELVCPFTLKQPVRACFLLQDTSKGTDDLVAIRLHHALYDAVSLPLLVDDLFTLYAQGELTTHRGMSAFDFTKYADRLKASKKGQAKQYWTGLLDDMDACIVGQATRARNAIGQSFIFIRSQVQDVDRLQKSLRSRNIDGGLPAIVLAAWSKTVARMAGKEGRSATFGVYRQGRSAALDGVETIVGNCMNVLPVAVKSTALSTGELAQELQKQMDEQREWEDVTSFHEIQGWLGLDQVPWNSYVNLLWSDAQVVETKSPGFDIVEDMLVRDTTDKHPTSQRLFALPSTRSDLSIDVQLDSIADELHFGVKWMSGLLTQTQIEEMIGSLSQIIKQATDDLPK